MSQIKNRNMIPQLIYIALVLVSFGINLAEHGKPRTGKYNAWISFFSLIIAMTILYYGGFFNPLLNR